MFVKISDKWKMFVEKILSKHHMSITVKHKP